MKNVPTNSSILKSKADQLDVDKLVTVPVDLSKLRDAEKIMLLKKLYIILRWKILKINLATNTTLDAKINEVKGEIPGITNLAAASALNAKINEVKGKDTNITNLATTTAVTTVEKKIPNVSNLVKKTDRNTKISDIEN